MKKYVLAFVLIAVAAAAAPPDKQISTAPSIIVKTKARFIWALLVNVEDWADWNPAVHSATLKKGDGQSMDTKIKFVPVINGEKAPAVNLKIERSEENELLEFKAKRAGMHIVFGFKIEEFDFGCKVTSYETISGPGTPVFEKLYGQEGLDKEHQQWVEAIKKKLEPDSEKGE